MKLEIEIAEGSGMEQQRDLLTDPGVALEWLRERSTQLLTFVQSVIALGIGFQLIGWTPEQVGLTMAVVAGLFNIVAYADQKGLRDRVSLHELAKVEFDQAVVALQGQPVPDSDYWVEIYGASSDTGPTGD